MGLSGVTLAQTSCHAGYTYTIGTAGSVNFTNTSTGGSGSTTYHWDFGDKKSSNISSPSHTYLYNGTYLVNFFMYDTTGSCFDSLSEYITIINGLTCNIAPNFSYSSGSGGQLNFTNTSTNVPAGSNYSWNFGDGTGSSQISPSHSYNFNGPYTVQLFISDSTGFCSNSTAQTVTVTTGNTCNINVSYTYTISSNGKVYFTNTTTGADVNATINWDFGNGYSSQSSPIDTYTNGTYIVKLTVGDTLSPCSGTYIDTLTITNGITPPSCGASFADTLRNGGLVNFINSSWGTISGSAVYSWNFGDGSTSSLQNPSHTYTYNGSYLVSLNVTDSINACFSSITDTIVISSATPAPCVATVSFNMHQDSLNPQPGIWEVGTNYSSQITSAVWTWGDGSYSYGQLYPTHTYSVAGKYTICVMAFASCGDSAYVCQNDSLFRVAGTNQMIQVTVLNANAATGIKTITEETAQVSLYPNPSAGKFTLLLSNTSAAVTKAQINISNILGEVIYSAQEPVNNNLLAKDIDLQNTANGAYFMQVSAGTKTFTTKVIINR